MTGLVVGGDGDIDKLQGSIGIAEGDNGDVDVGSFTDGLVVNTGVGDDDETGLLERAGDVVGEGTGGETACDGLSTDVGGEFEDGTVTVGTSGNDTDIVGVLDGSDDSGSKDELLPGLANVEDMDA
jgi:hypothetical protein